MKFLAMQSGKKGERKTKSLCEVVKHGQAVGEAAGETTAMSIPQHVTAGEAAGETAGGAGEEGHPKQEDTKKDAEKEHQEPSQKLKPPLPIEMFQVVAWPQEIFEEEEKDLEWHELSGLQCKFYEEKSAMDVWALMNFMMTRQGGTLQEFASLDPEQRSPYYSDHAWGGMSSETDLDYLSRLDPGWMPWRMNSFEKMKAGG
jgi:hypothetical protein